MSVYMFRKYTFCDFEKMANKLFSQRYSCAGCLPAKYVEEQFWHEIAFGKTESVEYACDIDGSAFSTSSSDQLARSNWNLKVLIRLTSYCSSSFHFQIIVVCLL